jgi:GT2 family glycosyltransferase
MYSDINSSKLTLIDTNENSNLNHFLNFGTLDLEACLKSPKSDVVSWHGHIPFAFSLVQKFKPRIFVELGTHKGDSYLAFCEANLNYLQGSGRYYAIDHWQGDLHAGYYDEKIFFQLSSLHNPRYGSFSNLIKLPFSNAKSLFNDNSIDLLHIDGLHSYEACRSDFEEWKSKLSDRAIVLFHDINSFDQNFGVWRFWNELKQHHHHFEFFHSHGLGVLAYGSNAIKEIPDLFLININITNKIRSHYSVFGHSLLCHALETEIVKSREEFEEKRRHVEGLLSENADLLSHLQATKTERDSVFTELVKSREEFEEKRRHVEGLLSENADLLSHLQATKTERDSVFTELVKSREEFEESSTISSSRIFALESALVDVEKISNIRRLRISKLESRLFLSQKKNLTSKFRIKRYSFIPPILRPGYQIRKSFLFDSDYYLRSYPDVAISGIQSYVHYWKYGASEGRDPHPLFSTSWYQKTNLDVLQSDMNPLRHFLLYGAKEGRSPHPLFDIKFYTSMYPEVLASGMNPVEHYLIYGAIKGYRPHWLFDPSYYASNNLEVNLINPLIHYLTIGFLGNQSPHRLFDPDFYLSQCPQQIIDDDFNPLVHFLTEGYKFGLNPNSEFNMLAYRDLYPELKSQNGNPFVHYVSNYDYSKVACDNSSSQLVEEKTTIAHAPQTPPAKLVQYLDEEWGCDIRNEIIGHINQFHLPVMSVENILDPIKPVHYEEYIDWVNEIESFSFGEGNSNPIVSIIIPVFNNLTYTLSCIKSVLTSKIHFSYEIIVADDCSSDFTQEIFQNRMKFLKYVRGEENKGFIKNCNNAAMHANGQYLVFLNNDTIVLPGWLDELIGTLKVNDDIGLVGSKLIYPNGLLQEAGGIIWQDASAWNYGRFDNPRKPEYSYLREVDYVSGASIALSRQLWNEMRGFDEWFDIAYGEDSDLCLRIHKSGRRVVIQPLSQLIHFEGVSSGTDTSSGIKSYQISNTKKLHDRWSEVLANYRINGIEPEREKERNVFRRALVIDHCTPTPDKDAGSVTCLEIMRSLQSNGFKVTFIPEDNFLFMPSETRALQRIGIEAVYWEFYGSVSQYLTKYGYLFDVVLVFRPNAGKRYIKIIQDLAPQAKIVYHVSDLHFIRKIREHEVLGKDQSETISIEEVRNTELDIIKQANCTIVHSLYEKKILDELLPTSNVYVFPWILDHHGAKKSFVQRNGVIFLGGYGHPPNIDAVLYFIQEVWPHVRKRLKKLPFFVVGSNVPPALKKLDGVDGVKVVGYVANLEEIFESVRVSVAPIRFGSGIKGKVAMSMAYGIPVVATSCAAEGMGLVHGKDAMIIDNPLLMAEEIVRLHEDQILWESMSSACSKFAKLTYSRSLGNKRIAEIMQLAGITL